MIQRKQTLFLLQLIFLNVSLFFLPLQIILSKTNPVPVFLRPLTDGTYHSSLGHIAAISINALAIIMALVTIFTFKKRALQVKLCYVLILLYVILIAMFAFCPFVSKNENIVAIQTNAFGYIICSVSILSAFLASVFIKKDIELLKSTDRIR